MGSDLSKVIQQVGSRTRTGARTETLRLLSAVTSCSCGRQLPAHGSELLQPPPAPSLALLNGGTGVWATSSRNKAKSGEKVSSMKLVSGAKKVGDHCLKGLGLFFFPLFSLIQLMQLNVNTPPTKSNLKMGRRPE